MSPQPEKPFGSRERFQAAAYALAILWLNVYIGREFFLNQTAWMNSMHGFWIALAERSGGSWFRETWWPYWDGGIPFEFTYAPLVPAITAVWAAIGGVPHGVAFNAITGLAFCLVPLTLFAMVWLTTRAPGYGFAAALFYSLTAPTQLLAPDTEFAWSRFFDTRRLFVLGVWDETPHMIALVFLPLTIVLVAKALATRRPVFAAASVVSIALASLSSAFGPVDAAIAVICLLAVAGSERWMKNLILVAAIGVFAWALCASYYSPTLLRAIIAATGTHGEGQWGLGSLAAILIATAGGFVVQRLARRVTSEESLQFFALFAYAMCVIPMLAQYAHLQFLPQTTRYKLEMEVALAPLVAVAARGAFDAISKFRFARPARAAAIVILLAAGFRQTMTERSFASSILSPADLTHTVEYRASMWAAQNLPGARVMLPGSIAAWANTFTDIQQFGGGSWSMAANMAQVRGLYAVYNGGAPDFRESPERDAATALLWLKAFGAGAVGVSAAGSAEYYKPFSHPGKFEGLLPVLWNSDGVTIYRVPLRTSSLAHLVPETALVARTPKLPGDTAPLTPYVAALDDSSTPLADFRWEGRNRIRIDAPAPRDLVLSIQVSFSPGWHATVAGRPREIMRDGLGFMWLRPDCPETCEVDLFYDGGLELRTCRLISVASACGILLVFLGLAFRGVSQRRRAG